MGQPAVSQKWMKKANNDEKERQMIPADFQNIRFSLLNMQQITKCKLNKLGRIDKQISKHCWKQPNLDDFDAYIEDYGSEYGL